jgi:spore germination protein PB
MIINVHQTITINSLRVESLSNSSILQIGAAGMIKGLSNSFNTGGFKGPAPEAKAPGASSTSSSASSSGPVSPLVPLPALE